MSLVYCGPWQSSTEYSKGQFVSFGGSMWHCNATTTSRPDEGGVLWTLAVKGRP